jgi:hypothetical protein
MRCEHWEELTVCLARSVRVPNVGSSRNDLPGMGFTRRPLCAVSGAQVPASTSCAVTL